LGWGARRGRPGARGGARRAAGPGGRGPGAAGRAHASVQPAGMVQNPQHKIEHSEIICVMEGTLEFQHGDKAERVGPGGVIFVAFETLHTVKNVGDGVARYVVVAVGGDTK